MGLRPNLLTRRAAGVASTTLALLLSTAAVGVVPAASAFSAAPGGVLRRADRRPLGRPGEAGRQRPSTNPNELTAEAGP